MRFRYIVTAAALAYIAWMLAHHGIWSDGAALTKLLQPAAPVFFAGLVLGLPLNIALETAKWRAMTATPCAPWSKSAREVLIGTTFALVTPNRIGDAAARVALLPASQRAQGATAWAVGAWAQAGWTWTLGTAAWWAYTWFDWTSGVDLPTATVFSIGGALVAATLVWWALPSLLQMRLPRRWHDRLAERWGTVKTEEAKNHRRNQIILSGLRYAVFATQFACAVAAWGGAFSWETYGTIAVVYLGNMVVPTAALAELGVREALIVAWAQPVGDALPALVAATFAVWVVNLGLPALVGSWMQFNRHV